MKYNDKTTRAIALRETWPATYGAEFVSRIMLDDENVSTEQKALIREWLERDTTARISGA